VTAQEIIREIDKSIVGMGSKQALEFLGGLTIMIGYRVQSFKDLLADETGKKID
jgi:hypothetical protein